MTFEDLTWRPFVLSWLSTTFTDAQLPKEIKTILYNMFENNIDVILQKIRRSLVEPVVTCDLQLVKSLTNLLEVFLGPEFGFKPTEKIEKQKTFLSFAFAFALIWSLGASVSEVSQGPLSDLIKDRFPSFMFPNIGTVYQFYFDPENMAFKGWEEKLKNQEFVYNKELPYWNLVVPTADSVKYSYFIEWLLHYNHQVFVTGGSGVGKSVVVQNLLNTMSEKKGVDPLPLIFSAQTSSQVT